MAEGARLESVYAGNRIEGSNPSPSANKSLIFHNIRSGFEPPLQFGAFCGAQGEGTLVAEPERINCPMSPGCSRIYSLWELQAVRFQKRNWRRIP